jgi:DNA-3-methyladenine glycosylase
MRKTIGKMQRSIPSGGPPELLDQPEKLDQAFFRRSAPELAQALLGIIMVRRVEGVIRRARLFEVEAYCGPKDLASHSSKGRTARTEVMFGPPGRAYVYFIYGMHWMFNVVGGEEGHAQAVLIRSGQPLDDWDAKLVGPARLARAFGITRADNRMDLTGEDIFFLADPAYQPRVIKTRRIGVDYARHWKDRLLRFIDRRNPHFPKLRIKTG